MQQNTQRLHDLHSVPGNQNLAQNQSLKQSYPKQGNIVYIRVLRIKYHFLFIIRYNYGLSM